MINTIAQLLELPGGTELVDKDGHPWAIFQTHVARGMMRALNQPASISFPNALKLFGPFELRNQ